MRYEPQEVPPHRIAVGLGGARGGDHPAGDCDRRGDRGAGGGRVGQLPGVGGVLGAAGERLHDADTGGAVRAYRVGAHPDHGDVGGVLRGVHRGAVGERAGDHGEPDRRIVAVPVPAGGHSASLAGQSAIYASTAKSRWDRFPKALSGLSPL